MTRWWRTGIMIVSLPIMGVNLLFAPAKAQDTLAADDPSIDFSVAIDVARNGMKDWKAYPDLDESDQRKTSFDSFSHLVDVAQQFFDDCEDMALRRDFHVLKMERYLGEMPGTSFDIKDHIIALEALTLDQLWLEGLAKTKPDLYAEYKREIVDFS